MATNKRTYPNTYFTWYNDDNRLAILLQLHQVKEQLKNMIHFKVMEVAVQ
jgi:hypothetical protein